MAAKMEGNANEDEDGGSFKLDRKFAKKVHNAVLVPLLPIMRGLMHF